MGVTWELEKRTRPKPAPVNVRYVDGHIPPQTVPATEMARRKEETKWLRETVSETISWDLWGEQKLLALKRDDTITVPDYTGEVWWFVLDVDGPARAITADTLLFDRPFERRFPFRMVDTRPLENWDEKVESWVALDRLNQLRGRDRKKQPPPPLAQAA